MRGGSRVGGIQYESLERCGVVKVGLEALHCKHVVWELFLETWR